MSFVEKRLCEKNIVKHAENRHLKRFVISPEIAAIVGSGIGGQG